MNFYPRFRFLSALSPSPSCHTGRSMRRGAGAMKPPGPGPRRKKRLAHESQPASPKDGAPLTVELLS